MGAHWRTGQPATPTPLPEGFDENFRDDAGRRPGDPGFVPPCYDDTYADAAGRRPGEKGFQPPVTQGPYCIRCGLNPKQVGVRALDLVGGVFLRAPVGTGLRAAYSGAVPPLDEFCYDENYRDKRARPFCVYGDQGVLCI
jgi:hypothetical protein